jgi:anti-sigma factor RsiW
MNCEEFELIGLDAGSGRLSIAEERAVAEHASSCAKCASLAESWGTARNELSLYKDATHAASAPARVEMRLLQELRAQKRPHERMRRTGVIAAWGLAAAAAIVGVVSWQNWRAGQNPAVVDKGNSPAVSNSAQGNQDGNTVLVADEDTGAFTPLPGAIPIAVEDGSIYQVRMQRASLGALGLPVNQDGASDWINVDLLVGDDGTPQGVRLHEDASLSGTIQ